MEVGEAKTETERLVRRSSEVACHGDLYGEASVSQLSSPSSSSSSSSSSSGSESGAAATPTAAVFRPARRAAEDEAEARQRGACIGSERATGGRGAADGGALWGYGGAVGSFRGALVPSLAGSGSSFGGGEAGSGFAEAASGASLRSGEGNGEPGGLQLNQQHKWQQHQEQQQQEQNLQQRQGAKPPPLKLAEGGGVQGSVLGRPYVALQSRFVVGRREIGRGQFGVIYKCVGRGAAGAAYACKTIKKRNIQSIPAAEDIRREVETMECVRGHPGIVDMNAAFEDPGAIHIVMQLCRHGDLFDYIKTRTRLSEATAACILSQLLQALQHCHTMGVIHRDVKPENVLIYGKGGGGAGEGRGDAEKLLVKLGDFGVATRFSQGLPCTDAVGTAMYMAPELLRGCYGPPADIWSAGVVLYVMLSGALPFFACKSRSLCDAILHGPVRMEGPRWDGVSEAAKAVVRRMLEKDPAQRATIEQVHETPWMKTHSI
ncbi:hypothetical protein CLOP_g2767 [Closterium sp. NIES-67]|nr:hypothetical protein CLOP_g2767 [Closterium sp. NIES-67]